MITYRPNYSSIDGCIEFETLGDMLEYVASRDATKKSNLDIVACEDGEDEIGLENGWAHTYCISESMFPSGFFTDYIR